MLVSNTLEELAHGVLYIHPALTTGLGALKVLPQCEDSRLRLAFLGPSTASAGSLPYLSARANDLEVALFAGTPGVRSMGSAGSLVFNLWFLRK
jgi:hypothetical protein